MLSSPKGLLVFEIRYGPSVWSIRMEHTVCSILLTDAASFDQVFFSEKEVDHAKLHGPEV